VPVRWVEAGEGRRVPKLRWERPAHRTTGRSPAWGQLGQCRLCMGLWMQRGGACAHALLSGRAVVATIWARARPTRLRFNRSSRTSARLYTSARSKTHQWNEGDAERQARPHEHGKIIGLARCLCNSIANQDNFRHDLARSIQCRAFCGPVWLCSTSVLPIQTVVDGLCRPRRKWGSAHRVAPRCGASRVDVFPCHSLWISVKRVPLFPWPFRTSFVLPICCHRFSAPRPTSGPVRPSRPPAQVIGRHNHPWWPMIGRRAYLGRCAHGSLCAPVNAHSRVASPLHGGGIHLSVGPWPTPPRRCRLGQQLACQPPLGKVRTYHF